MRVLEVTQAVLEVDSLLTRLFSKHFGDGIRSPVICSDYLEAIFRFATDTLPPAAERDARIADDDPRKSTAARHTLDGDLMWFCWSLHTEGKRPISPAWTRRASPAYAGGSGDGMPR